MCISLFITLLMSSVGNRVAATVDLTVSELIQSNESPVLSNTWFLQLTDRRGCGELHLSADPVWRLVESAHVHQTSGMQPCKAVR